MISPSHLSTTPTQTNNQEKEKERLRNDPNIPDDVAEAMEDAMDATWRDVAESCCIHTPVEWGWIALGLLAVTFFLYFFLFSLELLGTGAKVMTGCRAGALFGEDTNPIAGITIGILSTVLLQSSSTTTSIVVSLVGSVVTVDQGIYMVMGANIGTSVTNTIVAMGQLGDGDELERAFAGATVHDLFNFLTVGALLIVEVITGYLHELNSSLSSTRNGESWEGPLSKIVDPLAEKVLKENKDVIKAVAKGGSCDDFFPVNCTDGIETADTCSYGLIKCNSDTNECPAFFHDGASQGDDIISGGVCFIIALFLLFVCLAGLVTVLRKLTANTSARIVYKATNLPGIIGIAVGCGITLIVQSSSITTSVLTPLVGVNVVPLESMYPITLGANLGTTLSAIMAAMVSDNVQSLQVALAHLFFNITGIIIWYPIPLMRRIPLNGARALGRMTRIWKGFPLVYIGVTFFLVPLFFLGLSTLYTQDSQGWEVLGILITLICGILLLWVAYWLKFKQGKAKMIERFQERERKRKAYANLADHSDSVDQEIDLLKRQVKMLIDHTGAEGSLVYRDLEKQIDEEAGKTSDRSPEKTENSDDKNDKEVET